MSSSETGSESADDARASTLGPEDYSRNIFGGMSLNASGRAKMGYTNPSYDDGNSFDQNLYKQQQAAALRQQIDAARATRASALQKQQTALAQAFGGFDDDYYGDLETSYKDFANTGLQSAYDDSLRGIYQGFKQKGLLSQGEVNAAVSALDAQRAVEQNRIDKAAAAYAQAKRDEVSKKQQSLGSQLSGMAGGASTVADINKQTENINTFDFGSQLEKLRSAGAKDEMDFFEGYEKVGAGQQPNVAPTYSNTGGLGSALVNPGQAPGSVSTQGVQSPFQGSSTKVIS